LIKPIKILKKPTGSVRFRFYKPETEKTKPNRTEKTKPNWFGPVFVLKNRIETDRFEPILVFFFKNNSVWLLFFNKNRTEPKMITLVKSDTRG
jgi:hypothetical protein